MDNLGVVLKKHLYNGNCVFYTSHYDYTPIAEAITRGLTGDMEKIRAIYDWITRNIAYDTSFKIFHADECWDKGKGVCQAYSELMVEIAAKAGIELELVTGPVKKAYTGEVERDLHAWVIYRRKGDKIHLFDPTWGAGVVSDGVFTFAQNNGLWWDVDPNIMIFTHYSKDYEIQALYLPLTEEEWLNLPPLSPACASTGLRSDELLDMARKKKTIDFPMFYNSITDRIKVIEIPLKATLKAQKTYEFKVRSLYGNDIKIYDSSGFHFADKVENDVYHFKYTPHSAGDMSIVAMAKGENSYIALIKYNVEGVSAIQQQIADRDNPWQSQDVIKFAGYKLDKLKALGFNGVKLLSLIKRQAIEGLPDFFNTKGFDFKVGNIPYNYALNVGKQYTFTIRLTSRDQRLALKAGEKWLFDWDYFDDLTASIRVTPTEKGELFVLGGTNGSNDYSALLKYKIK